MSKDKGSSENSIDKLKVKLEKLMAEEESELRKYVSLINDVKDSELKEILQKLIEDTIVHYYVLKGLIEALREIEMLHRKISMSQGTATIDDIAARLLGYEKPEKTINQEFSEAIQLSNTNSMRAILEEISKEEKRHSNIILDILERAGYKKKGKKR